MDEKFVTLHLVVVIALEQDRHLLKRKLETVRSEYDIRITELQADIRELSRSLTERESVLKQSEKEKAALITELTEQNDRLTSQLKENVGGGRGLGLGSVDEIEPPDGLI
uniref:Uncharacterized protein n=1 Tax=Timema genevievae TaxID=629358 RepID=A0A7R9K8C9_TIMGE|nr:unnamed protein product [Timema genevievae]